MLAERQSAPLRPAGGSQGAPCPLMTRAGPWPPEGARRASSRPALDAVALPAPGWPRPQLRSPTTGSLGATTSPRCSPALNCPGVFSDNALGLTEGPRDAAATHGPQLQDAPGAAPIPGPTEPRGLGLLTARGPRGCGLTRLLVRIPELAVFLGALWAAGRRDLLQGRRSSWICGCLQLVASPGSVRSVRGSRTPQPLDAGPGERPAELRARGFSPCGFKKGPFGGGPNLT